MLALVVNERRSTRCAVLPPKHWTSPASLSPHRAEPFMLMRAKSGWAERRRAARWRRTASSVARSRIKYHEDKSAVSTVCLAELSVWIGNRHEHTARCNSADQLDKSRRMLRNFLGYQLESRERQ
jgi:hypothetical protein